MKNSKNKSINGEVWSEFCDSLKRSGRVILNEESLSDLDFYEGWRYLTRLTRLGLEMALENNDPYFPFPKISLGPVGQLVDIAILFGLSLGDESKTVALALYARYLKRIGAHLKNITTVLVNPFDAVGYKK